MFSLLPSEFSVLFQDNFPWTHGALLSSASAALGSRVESRTLVMIRYNTGCLYSLTICHLNCIMDILGLVIDRMNSDRCLCCRIGQNFTECWAKDSSREPGCRFPVGVLRETRVFSLIKESLKGPCSQLHISGNVAPPWQAPCFILPEYKVPSR